MFVVVAAGELEPQRRASDPCGLAVSCPKDKEQKEKETGGNN